jgi:hypothetical protein
MFAGAPNTHYINSGNQRPVVRQSAAALDELAAAINHHKREKAAAAAATAVGDLAAAGRWRGIRRGRRGAGRGSTWPAAEAGEGLAAFVVTAGPDTKAWAAVSAAATARSRFGRRRRDRRESASRIEDTGARAGSVPSAMYSTSSGTTTRTYLTSGGGAYSGGDADLVNAAEDSDTYGVANRAR